MALLEATNTLLDFDLLQNYTDVSLSSLSPVSPSLSSDSSATPWNGSSDGESNMTSLTNVTSDVFSVPQTYTIPEPACIVDSVLGLNERLTDDIPVRDFNSVDFTSGFEAGISAKYESSTVPRKSARQRDQKVRKDGRKIPRPTSANNKLPPCRICAGAASGFHYGVNSCEACKRFFRRALKRKRNFKCRGNKNCSIKGKKNGVCGYCRYKRCLALGMSKTAIKTGRYTQEKRAQDTLEVHKLVSEDNAVTMSDAEVEEIVQKLNDVHSNVLTNADVPEDVMVRCVQQKMEEFQLKKEMFGFQDTLTPEQYDEVFQVTGLDLDERQKDMKFIAKSIDTFVYGYAQFGKGIPGFAELPLKDQANLLKLSRVEVWFISAYRGFLKEYDMFYAPNRVCKHRYEMIRFLGKEYLETAFELADYMMKLNLSHEEEVVLKAICLTFSDRCQMEEAAKVEAVQWKMLRCLLHLVKKKHPEDPALFYKVMNCIIAVRNLTELSRKALNNTHFADAIRSNATLVDMILI